VFHTGLSTPLGESLYLYLQRRRETSHGHEPGRVVESLRLQRQQRVVGSVVWWKRGNGEIAFAGAGGEHMYVHYSQLCIARGGVQELEVGQDVEFSVEANPEKAGCVWATCVTQPGGTPLPGTCRKAGCGGV